jgi:hypothetical protein
MKKTSIRLTVWLALSLPVFWPSLSSADTAGLVSMLVNKLNVTETQAAGGAGAIFSAAKSKMTPDDFTKVSKALPGIDALMAAAPSSGGANGLSSVLGGFSGSAGQLADLAGAFGKLGLESTMVGKYVDIILQYADSEAGQAVKTLLEKALR